MSLFRYENVPCDKMHIGELVCKADHILFELLPVRDLHAFNRRSGIRMDLVNISVVKASCLAQHPCFQIDIGNQPAPASVVHRNGFLCSYPLHREEHLEPVGFRVFEGDKPNGVDGFVVYLVEIPVLFHRLADEPVVPFFQIIDKFFLCYGFQVDAGRVLFIIVGHDYDSRSLAFSVGFEEVAALFLEQGKGVLVFHRHAAEAGKKSPVLDHIAFRNPHILFQNLRRGNLVVADEVKGFVYISGTIPVKFRKVFVLVVVVEVIEHPLVCQEAPSKICPHFLEKGAFKMILRKEDSPEVKKRQLHFFDCPSGKFKKVHYRLLSSVYFCFCP